VTTLEALKDAHARAIAENPVEIVVHRVAWSEDGEGGRSKTETDLPPFTGRLVPGRPLRYGPDQDEAGLAWRRRMVLLAPHDADLRAGSGVEDTFTVEGIAYRVVWVTKRCWGGEIYAVQADVEEVV